MAGHSTYEPQTGFTRWLDSRLPILRFANDTMTTFPTPRNLNMWWTFGGILTLCLAVQIVTGVVLAMHYVANADLAFDSVENIMRNVNYGWLLRYMHANGASMFFLAVYIHMFRGLYYGSYKAPREVLWILGVIIYLLMMATAFFGYVLPWGQMSFTDAAGEVAQVLVHAIRHRAVESLKDALAYLLDCQLLVSDMDIEKGRVGISLNRPGFAGGRFV